MSILGQGSSILYGTSAPSNTDVLWGKTTTNDPNTWEIIGFYQYQSGSWSLISVSERSTTAPSDINKVWLDSNFTPPVIKTYDGSAWVPLISGNTNDTQIAINSSDVISLFGEGFSTEYNGVNSESVLNENIELSSEGDYLEFNVKLNDLTKLVGIIGQQASGAGINTSIGWVANKKFYIVDSDGSVVFNENIGEINPPTSFIKIRLEYIAAGQFQVLRDGVQVGSIISSPNLIINNIGKSAGYADITVGKVEISASGIVHTWNTSYLAPAIHTDVSLLANEQGLLTDSQLLDLQMVDTALNYLDNIKSGATQLVRQVSPLYSFQGFLRVTTATPSPTDKHCYIAIEAGTVAGVADVEVGDFLVGTGSEFEVKKAWSSTIDKKDFIWNLDEIPNIDTDGFPSPTEADRLLLTAIYYSQPRSYFRAGRLNQRTTFPTADAQYSASFGWSTHCVDANENPDGNDSKGGFTAGYQNVNAGPYNFSFGRNNLVANTGGAMGEGNQVNVGASNRFEIIGQTFVDDWTKGSLTIAGDKTGTFPDGKILAIYLYAPTESPILIINRVETSTYDAGADETTLNMLVPLGFEYADATTLDSFGILNKSYVFALGVGSQYSYTIGLFNKLMASYGFAIGVNITILNTLGFGLGSGVVTKNRGEIGTGSGQIEDGTDLRYSQKSQWHLKTMTENATPKELTIDGKALAVNSNNIRTQNSSVLTGNIRVSAYYPSGSAGGQSYSKIWDNVVIRHKSNGVMNILFESTPLEVTESDTTAFDAVLSVASDGRIIINVTGHASNKVYWTAWVEGVMTGENVPTRIN